MPTFFTRILLFLSSYVPLLFILTLRTFERLHWWSAAFAGVGLISLLTLLIYLRIMRRFAPFTIRAEKVERKDLEAMTYIASYVIPFVELPSQNWKGTTGLVVFVLMLGIIYVNSNMIHINPMLNAMGYHLLEIEVAGVLHSLITKKRHLRRGSEISVHKLGNDIFLEASA